MTSILPRLRSQPFLFAGLVSVVLLVATVIAQPDFAKPANWPQELAALAPLMLVAMASTPAILSGGGGLDLSVGPLTVLCNVLLVHELLPGSLHSVWLAVPILLVLGAAVGAVNGVLVSLLRYQPVIATLCMTFVLTGISLKIGATPRPAGHNWTQALGDKIVGPVPGALVLLLAAIGAWWALGRTSFHRNLYGVGGNDVSAYAAGVNVAATRIMAYALGGVFAALGGVALTALVQSSQAQATSFYILVGLTAVALGGTPLSGGRGGLTGAALGACALYLMQSLLFALSVPPNWVNVVYGAMLVVGVVVGARARLVVRRPGARSGSAASAAGAAA